MTLSFTCIIISMSLNITVIFPFFVKGGNTCFALALIRNKKVCKKYPMLNVFLPLWSGGTMGLVNWKVF